MPYVLRKIINKSVTVNLALPVIRAYVVTLSTFVRMRHAVRVHVAAIRVVHLNVLALPVWLVIPTMKVVAPRWSVKLAKIVPRMLNAPKLTVYPNVKMFVRMLNVARMPNVYLRVIKLIVHAVMVTTVIPLIGLPVVSHYPYHVK